MQNITQSQRTILIGEDRVTTDPSGYRQLLKFYKECYKYNNESILIDFKRLSWLNGNMCALLYAMLHKLNKEKKLNFSVDFENVQHIKKKMEVLFRNGFIKNPEGKPNYISAVELRTFEADHEQNFVNYIEHSLFENVGMKIDSETKRKMIDKFLEMYSNIQLHAQTKEPVFACGQYFKSEKRLHFTLVDLGVGYLIPIEEHTNGEIRTSAKAIDWALLGNSTKKDAPGGTGLVDLLNYCKETDSHMNIVTGDAYWGNNLGEIGVREIDPFCGTTVHMLFNCK